MQSFENAITAAGLDYRGPIIPDSQLHRFKANGDRSKNSWYVLHADGIAAGSFGCHKRGIQETWCAKSAENLTDEERAERDRRWKQQAEERDAERRRQQADASRTAEGILAAAQPATGDHPYLIRKAVMAHPGVMVGAWPQRKANNCLLIPLRTAAGRLASVQAIFSEKRGDRDKDFLKGGAKTGAYFVIGDPDASDSILIAEGYATTATLFELTGDAAVMACDAGNLKPVAQAIRALYPGKSITVCGDNDRTTEGNPGLTQGKAAAKSVKALLAVPEFADDEPGSDFNDLARLDRERVIRIIHDAGRPEKPDRDTSSKKTFANVVGILESGHWKGIIGFNAFLQCIEKRKATSYDKKPGPWTDYDSGELRLHLELEHKIAFSAEVIEKAIDLVARRNRFNPAEDRLLELAGQWDGISRLASWLSDYLNATINEGNKEYLAEIGAAWMKGITARVLFQGCKRDDVIVLVGAQGWRKSTAARLIAETIHPDSFIDSIDLSNLAEARIQIRGIILAELAELNGMRKAEASALKSFVTASVDRYREKYGIHKEAFPRTVSFIGTTNEEQFLIDPTGNRRFWPVPLAGCIDTDRLQAILPQLLGEAARRVLDGEAWHVTAEAALQQAEAVRDDHFDEDVWTEPVMRAVDAIEYRGRGHELITRIPGIWDEMLIPRPQQRKPEQHRVGAILRRNGYKECREWTDRKNNKSKRCWKKSSIL